jgi:hypothetical protein
MTQSNKSADKEFNKIYNGMVPTSMSDGGSNLDVVCGHIETASAGLDDDPTEFTESNGEVGEAINVGEKFGEVGEQVAGIAARAGAALMESDKKRGRR